MYHLSKDGATIVEDEEDNAYPILCTLGSTRSTSKSAWNEARIVKSNRQMNVMTVDALVHNTSTPREPRSGHNMCTIRSSAAMGRHPSSPKPAKMSLRRP